MDVSKPIWRVNRSPRFTALELGEYMAADEGPRETILRNMKYERIAPSLLYDTLNQAVASYLASPTRDARILERARQSIEAEREAADNPKRKENLTYELRALDAFEVSLNALGFRDVHLERLPVSGRKLDMQSVAVSVRPTVLVRASRPRGKDLIGSLLIDLAKGNTSKTDDAVGKRVKAMQHAAVLLQQHAAEIVEELGDDVRLSPEHCVVFHTYSQERISNPPNAGRMLRNMNAGCRNIARGWKDVEPPPTFDAARARYRG